MKNHRIGFIGLIAVSALAVQIDSIGAQEQESAKDVKGELDEIPIRYETFAFDNCRFFAPQTPSAGDLGSDGWVRITCRERRDYLSQIDPRRSALIVVDMQKGVVMGKNSWASAIAKYDKDRAEWLTRRTRDVAIPNINRLTELFRKQDMLIVFLTLGEDSAIMPGIETQFDRPKEFLVRKFSAGAFATSTLDNLLREFGIATTFIVGFDTPACVNATFWGAYDHSYQPIIIEDGCTSGEPDLHEAAIKIWRYMAYVRTTDQVINDYPWQNWIDPSIQE